MGRIRIRLPTLQRHLRIHRGERILKRQRNKILAMSRLFQTEIHRIDRIFQRAIIPREKLRLRQVVDLQPRPHKKISRTRRIFVQLPLPFGVSQDSVQIHLGKTGGPQGVRSRHIATVGGEKRLHQRRRRIAGMQTFPTPFT